MQQTDLNNISVEEFEEMVKSIVATDKELEFINATRDHADIALNEGLTITTTMDSSYLSVKDEPDGPWNYVD